MYSIYKITNLANGMMYIGQTRQKLNLRFGQHVYKASHCEFRGCPLISEAIKEYGRENFTIVPIDHAHTREEAFEKEKFWIEKLNTTDRNVGYNLALGKERYGETNGFFGKHHSQKTIDGNIEHQKNRKQVRDVNTGIIYRSIRECARVTGVCRIYINRVCRGIIKAPTLGNFEFVERG